MFLLCKYIKYYSNLKDLILFFVIYMSKQCKNEVLNYEFSNHYILIQFIIEIKNNFNKKKLLQKGLLIIKLT